MDDVDFMKGVSCKSMCTQLGIRICAVEMHGCDDMVCSISIHNVFVSFSHTVYSSRVLFHSAHLAMQSYI